MPTETVAVRLGAGERAEHLERAAIRWGIVETVQKAHWLGQLAHETNSFTSFTESFNYSVAGLADFVRFGRLTQDQANALGRIDRIENGRRVGVIRPAAQQTIANIVYANRYGNRGPESGDGWKFRGRGDKQITFQDNYRRCSLALFGDLRLLEDPTLLTLPEHGPQAAGWFWSVNGCNALASDLSDAAIRAVTIRINGGVNGLADRARRTRQVFDLFRAMEVGP